MSRLFNTGKTAPELELDRIAKELASKKITALSKVKAEYELRLNNGMPYKGYHIQLDEKSQTNLTGLVVKRDRVPYPTSWRVFENVHIKLVDEEEVNVLSDMALMFLQVAHGDICLVKDSINGAATSEEVETLTASYIDNRTSFVDGFIQSTTVEETVDLAEESPDEETEEEEATTEE